MTELDDFLTDMLPRQLEAERAFCNGNADLRNETWSRSDPVTLFGAASPARSGSEEVFATFASVARLFERLEEYEFELVAAGASADLAYTVGFEHKTVISGGERTTYSLRVTHVYRRENDEWRIVHRHGDHPPASPDRMPDRQSTAAQQPMDVN